MSGDVECITLDDDEEHAALPSGAQQPTMVRCNM